MKWYTGMDNHGDTTVVAPTSLFLTSPFFDMVCHLNKPIKFKIFLKFGDLLSIRGGQIYLQYISWN